jgi:hypothetical protein
LKAAHQNDRWRGRSPIDFLGGPSEQRREFISDDLDNRLVGGKAAINVLANSLFFDLAYEIFGYREVDVGLKKGNADFTEHFGDIVFVETAFGTKSGEDSGEPPGEVVEHSE